MTEKQIRHHSRNIATRMIALMGIVRTYIPGGKTFVDAMTLKTFFIIALEMCRQGIQVEHNTLLSADPILLLVAIGDNDMSKYWQEYVDKKNIRKNIPQLISKMTSLFTKAVRVDQVNPEYLRIDEMSISILYVPCDLFEGYRRT
jgi:hypothetical protein